MNPSAPTDSGNGARPAYKRVVLKLSGESLQGTMGSGIHAETVARIAGELKEVADLGVEVAIMVGGGNIFRGTRQKALSIDRATADYMGMLATVINGLALQDALEKQGAHTRLMSAIERVTADHRFHTPDLGGTARTADVTAAVVDAIHGANA